MASSSVDRRRKRARADDEGRHLNTVVEQFSSQLVCRVCTPVSTDSPAEVHPLPSKLIDFGKLGAMCPECVQECSDAHTHPLSGERLSTSFKTYAAIRGVELPNQKVVAAMERHIAAESRTIFRCPCNSFEIVRGPLTWNTFCDHISRCRDAQSGWTPREVFDLMKMAIDTHDEQLAKKRTEAFKWMQHARSLERDVKNVKTELDALRQIESRYRDDLQEVERVLRTTAQSGDRARLLLSRMPPPKAVSAFRSVTSEVEDID